MNDMSELGLPGFSAFRLRFFLSFTRRRHKNVSLEHACPYLFPGYFCQFRGFLNNSEILLLAAFR